jgi:tRNA dimethylallyltransferase
MNWTGGSYTFSISVRCDSRSAHVTMAGVERPLVAIVGPTASGKSDLALRIAQTFSGEIVNFDALQLYRGFDIGTAKTPVSERCGVSHHLFDVLDPQNSYSAGEYARTARETITEIASQGRLPVAVGGTGFYLRALLDGLPSLPLRDESLRARLSDREQRRPGALHRLLRRLEPAAAARIHSRDIQKLTRALEIRMLTRAALPPASSASPLAGFRLFQIGLAPDRTLLVEAIATRTRRMFNEGLIEEVQGLLAQGLSGDEKPFESLGYKQVLAYLRGQATLEEAQESTEIETRQYAKRQLTWFRRDPRVLWLDGFGSDASIIAASLEAVRKFLSE